MPRRAKQRRTTPVPIPKEETQTRRIPRRGATLPIIKPAPVPVISQQVRELQDIGFDVPREPQPVPQQSIWQRFLKILSGPVYPGPSLAERVLGDTSIYPGPSVASQILGGLTGEPVGQQVSQQVVSSGIAGGSFETALAEARKRAEEFSDPMNTIEAAAGHVGVALSNNYSPPFIMYEVQSYYGWTDAQMKAAGYVRGLGGWTLDIGEGDLPVSTGGSGGGGAGEIPSWSFPSFGGGAKNSFRGSSLINWRI